ncbi:tetratricopeptide repeat protein [bacterium]|nr:tetratricopeptide repeat protein [bacterium]
MRSTAEIADRDGFVHARVTLAEILALQGFTPLSEQILRSILDVHSRPVSPEIDNSASLYLGNPLVDQNRPREALDAYLKSLEISERENNRQQEASIWSNISLIHLEMKNWSSAEEAARRAIELNQQLKDTFELFSSWIN